MNPSAKAGKHTKAERDWRWPPGTPSPPVAKGLPAAGRAREASEPGGRGGAGDAGSGGAGGVGGAAQGGCGCVARRRSGRTYPQEYSRTAEIGRRTAMRTLEPVSCSVTQAPPSKADLRAATSALPPISPTSSPGADLPGDAHIHLDLTLSGLPLLPLRSSKLAYCLTSFDG